MSDARVRVPVGRRRRLSCPGRRIILIHQYGQPDAIAAMVRPFFRLGLHVLPTLTGAQTGRSCRRKTKAFTSAGLGGLIRPYVGTLEPRRRLWEPKSHVLFLSWNTAGGRMRPFQSMAHISSCAARLLLANRNESCVYLLATTYSSPGPALGLLAERWRSRSRQAERGAHENARPPARGRRVNPRIPSG